MSEITISLGYNCDPRIYMKKELKISKLDGYKSCPFDLCITSFNSLCKILINNFENFFDDLKIIEWGNADGNRSLAGAGITAISNKCNMIFNHEGGGHSHLFREGKNDDDFFSRNDFKEFKKRYSKRILNFKNYCKNYDEIIFIYKSTEFDESVIKNIIIDTYGEKNITFVSLN
jgi:hypothetical protein